VIGKFNFFIHDRFAKVTSFEKETSVKYKVFNLLLPELNAEKTVVNKQINHERTGKTSHSSLKNLMKLHGSKVLITGGSAGLGLESARQFLSAGASVIICGRNQAKLEEAKKLLPSLTVINCDISNPDQIIKMHRQIQNLGGINILYNNAGVGSQPLSLATANDLHYTNAAYEMDVNYLGVIRLNNLFMDMLKANQEAAIINTTSVLSYLPAILAPTYSATKTALRFYTESLRKHLEIAGSSVKVFELLPPLVETEMTAGLEEKKMSAKDVVKALINAVSNDQYTVRVGPTKVLYILYRFFPKFAFNFLNKKRNYKLLQ
jgi:uncharacterized oxidoreductase